MSKEKIIQRLLNPGVIAIVRATSSESLGEACSALLQGGIQAIEMTMTTPNALKMIRELREQWGEQMLLGVGSVLDVKTAEAALAAGAEYVVTPVLKPEVIAFCRAEEKPILAGAYTPTEAQTATELGADFVKIFPADGLGPKYIQALLGPLPHLKIIPTGGVSLATAGDFIRAGCVAVAAGSSLVSPAIIEEKNWSKLTDLAGQFVAAAARARSTS